MHSQQRTAQDLPQEHARNALLEHLQTGIVARRIQVTVVDGTGQHAQVVVEAAPLGIDDHLTGGLVIEGALHVLELGDLLEFLHVGTVGARPEDRAQQGARLTWRSV